jgi:SNF family Na+-dependent transporter
MITIPAAFIFLGATTVTAAVGSSFNLGFNTLPLVFQQMPLGQIVGFLFFFLLFLAAITSSLSMLQPAIALFEEGLGINRKASVTILGFITLIGSGLVLFFSFETKALDTLDMWAGTLCIYLLALYQIILYGWSLGPRRGMEELDCGAAIRVPRILGFMLKYVAPVYLLVIFAAFLYGEINKGQASMFAALASNKVVAISVGFLGLVTLFFLLIIRQSVRRWDMLDRAREGGR